MSDADPRLIDLRPKEFESSTDAPFANDRLDRKESVESLCSVIQNAYGPLVISVEGAYGTGKSAYLRMCAAHLEQGKAATVEFNAWQQGHTGRPLIDLVAALTTELADKGVWDDVKKTAKQVGLRAIGYLSRGIIAPNDPDESSMFDEWAEIDAGVTSFTAALREQVSELDTKLVILVDELDRCEPTYALDLLNKARHLFDVPGVVIVFGVNRVELGHAVETRYGSDCDVDGYLRRFVDLSVQLRQPTTEEWAAYLAHSCRELADCAPILQEHNTYVRNILALLADSCGGRLRDVEQVIRHLNLTLPHPNYKRLWPIWVICMLMLRYLDRDCYEGFVTGTADVWEVLSNMRQRLSGRDDIGYLDCFVLSLPDGTQIPTDENEFVQQYASKISGSEDDARRVHGWYTGQIRQFDVYGLPQLETLHKTLEIAATI
ncbi:KAP family P-loop NTPase fold protein [Candidatus Poriferisodalis multihospitum]|uniref:KAP family P-loop NTPase fold protein n=1 Tax=Candidatus Poriferisodalis multihospitum TaxID=2983191 RepID=UPI002B258888|nr:P-loop NTPase fold protein [Candidatus Poriferisodalis multihospitum]